MSDALLREYPDGAICCLGAARCVTLAGGVCCSAGLVMGMVDPTGQIVRECEAGRLPWRSIALTYAFAIRQMALADAGFRPANEAICKRFATPKDPDGRRALDRIKTLAWAFVDGSKDPNPRTTR